MYQNIFERYDEELVLVDYSPSVGDFHCKDEDYRNWLLYDAQLYIHANLSRVNA